MSASFQYRPPYSLSGESGKPLGPSRKSLDALGITAANLSLLSMETDTLRLTIENGTAPEYLQPVSCFDADGRRVFTGHATEIEDQWDGVKTIHPVTVSGPWWWLDKVQLTSIVQDDAGDEQERAIYTFPSQNLAVSLRTLIDRLQELGVPLRAGHIDPMFQVPQMQFQNGTGESVLTTMLQWVPDAQTSIRYETGGLPYLDIRRRPTAPHVTLDLKADTNRAGLPRISEDRSAIPTQVKVQTMEVNAAGEIIYGEDVAGDPDPPNAISRQLLALSGPGRNDYEPYTPRVESIQTETVPDTTSVANRIAVWALARAFDPVILKAEEEFGNVNWSSYSDYSAYPTIPRGIEGAGTYRLTAGQIFEWLTTEFDIQETQVRVTGWVFGTYPSGGYSDATTYLLSIQRAVAGFVSPNYIQGIFVDFTVPTINASYPSLTTLIHPDDQALIQPVPDLAANLFAAQNHIPVRGNVPLWPGAPLPLPGSRLNLRGGLPKWATMGAMTRGLSLDLRTGFGDCQLGRANRASASSLLNQFSRPLSGRIVRA